MTRAAGAASSVAFLSLALFASGCRSGADWRAQPFEARDLARASAPDVELPTGLWDKLEGDHHGVTEFAPIKAFLYEKTPGVLRGPPVELDFGEGGGEIDFAEYLTDHRGTFLVEIDFSGDANDSSEEPYQAYFLSNAVETTIGERRHGAGCAAYFDVTTHVRQAMKAGGLMVNTSDLRHAFALGGTLFFARKSKANLRLAQITFRDSRVPAARCRTL